jgi:hypothetical protein
LLEYPDKSVMGTIVNGEMQETEKLLHDEDAGDDCVEGPVNAVPKELHLGPFMIKLNAFHVANTIIISFTVLSTFSIISNILDVFNVA